MQKVKWLLAVEIDIIITMVATYNNIYIYEV